MTPDIEAEFRAWWNVNGRSTAVCDGEDEDEMRDSHFAAWTAGRVAGWKAGRAATRGLLWCPTCCAVKATRNCDEWQCPDCDTCVQEMPFVDTDAAAAHAEGARAATAKIRALVEKYRDAVVARIPFGPHTAPLADQVAITVCHSLLAAIDAPTREQLDAADNIATEGRIVRGLAAIDAAPQGLSGTGHLGMPTETLTAGDGGGAR